MSARGSVVAFIALAAFVAACGYRTHGPASNAKASPPQSTVGARDPHDEAEIAVGVLLESTSLVMYSEYGDSALSEYVTRVGKRIAARSERAALPWHFEVLDSPEMLAHGLPGGRVSISRGLLAFLDSEAELAAILAHEVAHVAFRHSHSKWDWSSVEEAGEHAEARKQQRESDQERQADTVGARYLADAGYAPRAMVSALAALERGAQYRTREKGVRGDERETADDDFDPHPAPPARIARAAVAAGARGGDRNLEWGRERFLERIAGIDWGEGAMVPRISGTRYVFPGELSFELPRGYEGTNLHGTLQARVSPDVSILVFRASHPLIRAGLENSLAGGERRARTIAGRRAIVGWKGPSAKETDASTTKQEGPLAIIEGRSAALIVITSGTPAAASRVLDELLASAREEPPKQQRRSVLTIERGDAKIPFDDFVRRRCPSTAIELARTLNVPSDIEPGQTIKCVKQL